MIRFLTPATAPLLSLPPETTCWVLTDGKTGDVVQCVGVAEALGLRPEQRVVKPRPPWSWIAPRGPVDPREAAGLTKGPLVPPYPDIAIASGRRAVPYLRAVKRASRGRSFTVFLKDPHLGAGAADAIWVPEHDRLRGHNVIVTLTSPHRLTQAALMAARAAPGPRLLSLPSPRVAMLIGGPSVHHRFSEADNARLLAIARSTLDGGCSLMVTPSRRTPPALTAALRALAAEPAHRGRCFVWDGEGSNPYLPILASAAFLIVTGDSVNMLGEAAMTGAPVYIVETTGGHAKVTRFIDRLVDYCAARRWAGHLEDFTYPPLDATPVIARAITELYAAFRFTDG